MSLLRWTEALRTPRSDAVPIAVLLFSCTVWGLMWWPLKRFGAAGLEGAPLTLLAYGGVGLLALPWLWRDRAAWRPQAGLLLGLMVVGGFANSAFVQALMLGDVVRVMLLFYLSPVWAVLGGRLFLGEAVGPRRALAVALALAGAFLVVGGTAALAQPLSLADALALLAGVAFAGNNLFARAAQRVPMASKAIAVFLGCGLASGAVCLLADAAPVWPATPALIAGVLGFGLGWVVIATVTWQYGVTHLEAGRSGVILIAELGVAVFSAVLLGEAALSLREAAGGLLIAAAALTEALSPVDSARPVAEPT
jgi:drug/metabolite transporter (DMT)-like permease